MWFLPGMAWFAMHARNRLILSTEEEFAQSLNNQPAPTEVPR